MIYLANALINPKVALVVYEKLQEIDFEGYLPNENVNFEGREININAFEQLKSRNPTNPHLIDIKKLIIKELVGHMVISSSVLICNSSNETMNEQTLFEIAIAWFIKKPTFSYNTFPLNNRELLSALNVIDLKGTIDKNQLGKTTFTEKEIENIKDQVVNLTKRSKKQKLSIKEG